MPLLKNPRYEIVAGLLAKGYSQARAYKGAGFKPDDAHASRVCKDGKVQARVREIRADMAASASQTAGYDAITIFGDVRRRAEAAAKAGDHKTALAGAIFIAECFGYKDSPTLTHDHVLGKKIEPRPEMQPDTPAGEGAGATDDANVMRFSGVLSELRKKREAR